jgi:serine/threonine protein kinase
MPFSTAKWPSLTKTTSDAGLEHRLRVESRVLASLEHPGIVPIHDADGWRMDDSFTSAKRVRGLTLREHLGTLPDTVERLRVFERICEPAAFAHAHGVIHRDLKPENIMIGEFGEVMVMDWASAAPPARMRKRPSIGRPPPTSTRPILNDYRHARLHAPETGGPDPVDRRADVFGYTAVSPADRRVAARKR